MSFRRTATLSACWALVAAAPASACGFREGAWVAAPIRQDAATQFVLVGHFENPRGTAEAGATDFVIARALKGDPALAGKTTITVPRRPPVHGPKDPPGFLVLGDVTGGKVDLNARFPASPALVAYVEGVLKIAATDRVGLMRFAFDSLDSADAAVSADAYAVFVTSADPDIRAAARTLAPDKLRGWLRAATPHPSRVRLYSYLLGNCGTAADASLLRGLLDKFTPDENITQLDGVFTGYTLLDPRAGWDYAAAAMRPDRRFWVRYSALRAARYFRTTHPGVLTEADVLRVAGAALDQPDIADIAVDYLRQWECWTPADRVLALATKPGFERGIVQRSVTRYALRCPGPAAARLVAERRKADPQRVAYIEKALKDEEGPAKP